MGDGFLMCPWHIWGRWYRPSSSFCFPRAIPAKCEYSALRCSCPTMVVGRRIWAHGLHSMCVTDLINENQGDLVVERPSIGWQKQRDEWCTSLHFHWDEHKGTSCSHWDKCRMEGIMICCSIEPSDAICWNVPNKCAIQLLTRAACYWSSSWETWYSSWAVSFSRHSTFTSFCVSRSISLEASPFPSGSATESRFRSHIFCQILKY